MREHRRGGLCRPELGCEEFFLPGTLENLGRVQVWKTGDLIHILRDHLGCYDGETKWKHGRPVERLFYFTEEVTLSYPGRELEYVDNVDRMC